MVVRVCGVVACLFLVMTSVACPLGYRAGAYGIRSAGITRTPPPADVMYAPSAQEVEVSGSPALRVEDDRAIFEWNVTPVFLAVRITNKSSRRDPSSESLVVLLDSAEFVDPGGGTHGLVPVSWVRNPPHVIAPGQRRVYRVFPADYGEERRALFGGPIPNLTVESPEGIRDLYREHVGKNFRIRLSVQVGEITYAYEFAMTVSEIHPYLARAIF